MRELRDLIESIRVAIASENPTPEDKAAGDYACRLLGNLLRAADGHALILEPPETIADISPEQAIEWLFARLRAALVAQSRSAMEEG